MTCPMPPDCLQASGRAFWVATVDKYELVEHELLILKEACHTVDLLDVLQASVDRDGPVLPWGAGVRANPATSELRQHRLVLARLAAALAIPVEDEERPAPPLRKPRGVYQPGRK
jgi:hypothetical protein